MPRTPAAGPKLCHSHVTASSEPRHLLRCRPITGGSLDPGNPRPWTGPQHVPPTPHRGSSKPHLRQPFTVFPSPCSLGIPPGTPPPTCPVSVCGHESGRMALLSPSDHCPRPKCTRHSRARRPRVTFWTGPGVSRASRPKTAGTPGCSDPRERPHGARSAPTGVRGFPARLPRAT